MAPNATTTKAPSTRLATSRGNCGDGKLTLAERVYAALKQDIITGVLRPGQSVTENDLAAQYSASRTPVREVAVRLQEEGLIRIVPNRGYFVTQLTIQEMNDVFEYRAAIESACAELACAAALAPKVVAEMEAMANSHKRNANFADFIAADTAFHVAIARLTQNSLMVRAVAQMRTRMERILFAAVDTIDPKYYGEVPAREHSAILRAIRRSDASLARTLMHDHIIGGKNKVLELARRGLQTL
jgi:GntR family transcriptional regulator, rspAB operon transcriptional repressor